MSSMRLDSVVFETPDLARVRAFYIEVLGLRVAIMDRDGRRVADESDSYVNFDAGTLLCFEVGGKQQGTIVLAIDDLSAMLVRLRQRGIEPVKSTPNFAIIHDPDGREVILQASK